MPPSNNRARYDIDSRSYKGLFFFSLLSFISVNLDSRVRIMRYRNDHYGEKKGAPSFIRDLNMAASSSSSSSSFGRKSRQPQARREMLWPRVIFDTRSVSEGEESFSTFSCVSINFFAVVARMNFKPGLLFFCAFYTYWLWIKLTSCDNVFSFITVLHREVII